jgi:hypothetical protein
VYLISKKLVLVSAYFITAACAVYAQASGDRTGGQKLSERLVRVPGAAAAKSSGTLEVAVSAASNGVVTVEGRFAGGSSESDLSFRDSYADASGLAKRISKLVLRGKDGAPLSFRQFGSSDFVAPEPIGSFTYSVNLSIPKDINSTAHVSWLTHERGLLMPGDLLPRTEGQVKIRLAVPDGWMIRSTEQTATDGAFVTDDPRAAVFFVGAGFREKSIQSNGAAASLLLAGEWQFSDDEAAGAVSEIIEEHIQVFGGIAAARVQLILLPFPGEAAADRWRAETRGSTVTIISSPAGFKSAALNRLREQLRHEIFHLWIPNALRLIGEYDWFYEGFALYQALKIGLRLNHIRFDDFLATLARAYDLARSQNVSLADPAVNRWASNGIYARGLVAAFLCDVRLLNNKQPGVDEIVREVFVKFGQSSNVTEDGNTAIPSLLGTKPELRQIVADYVKGAKLIEWSDELNMAGITFGQSSSGSELKVKDKPNGRQKALLDKLGYNQWRKSPR